MLLSHTIFLSSFFWAKRTKKPLLRRILLLHLHVHLLFCVCELKKKVVEKGVAGVCRCKQYVLFALIW